MNETLKQRTASAKPIDSVEQAFERALRYLGYRARSSAEVRTDLLRRGAANTVIDATLEKLRGLKYIDDEAFARDWALARAQVHGYGPGKIGHELRTKGVADRQIDAVVREIFAAESEEARARKVLQKRFKSENVREPRTLRRAIAYLQRRGYSSKVIFALLGSSLDDNS